MKWLALITVVLAASCSAGQPSYKDGVHPVSPDQAHPLFQQLLPVLDKSGMTSDDLIRTWKDFLEDAPIPLRQDSTFTFVYYDFSHSLNQVYLEASFAPKRKEPLIRVGTSPLFYAVYTVPKAGSQQYRFSTGTAPLPDPFEPNLVPGGEVWHPLVALSPAETTVQWFSGNAEAVLAGQDVRVLLPPNYRRNLAMTYPIVLIAGLDGTDWIDALDALLRDGTVRPFVAISVGSPAGLKAALEDRVWPWVKREYRTSPQAGDLVLVGWGSSAKAVQDMASSRPDLWSKIWTPSADQTRSEEAWRSLAPPFLRTLFPVVNP